MTNRFRAAAAALNIVHDKAQNLEKIHDTVAYAANNDIRLLVFPEGALQGHSFYVEHGFVSEESRYLWDNAETIPGPSVQLIADWIAEHEMYVIFGMWERIDYPSAPVLFNSAVLIGPEGYIGKYHKAHQPSEEIHYYQPGKEWPIFDTSIAQIGMLICYDQCFPESSRELTLRGAEVLAIPNAWTKLDRASDDRYDFFGRARAAENNRWVLQSNQVGVSDKGDFSYLGNSRIIDPTGTVVAQTRADQEGLAIAEITPTKFDPTQPYTGWYLHQRRPSIYTSLADDPSDF